MRTLVFLAFVLLLSGCVKTTEKLFTAVDECAPLKEQNDPEDMRDKYDSCLMFTDEELKEPRVCEKKCRAWCEKEFQIFEDTWIDFTGCHCYCKLDVSKQNI
jgi:hypothetical protein